MKVAEINIEIEIKAKEFGNRKQNVQLKIVREK